MDVLSVSACVQAVTSAFRDAAGLVQRIKEKQDSADGEGCSKQQIKEKQDSTDEPVCSKQQIKEKQDSADEEGCSKQQINELEISLDLGPPIVQGQYDSDFKKFGETYARGDSAAREQMKDVLITLQMAVLSNLTGVWMGTRSLDHRALQMASDDSRVNAVLCLLQWQQRLSSAAAAQQHKARPYPLRLNSSPVTPPLTNVSSRSNRSSLEARPSTPDERSDRMGSLSIAANSPESAYAPVVGSGQYVLQNSYTHQRTGGRVDTGMPSPLFARSRLSLSQNDSLTSPDVNQAIPARSPYRPSVASPQDIAQPRPATEIHGQGAPSPTPPHGLESGHHDSNNFGQSGRPRNFGSPPIHYAAFYSPTTYSTRRAPSPGSKASQTQSTSSDYSTLEPVSLLEPEAIHPAYRNDQSQSQAHAASSASAAPWSIPPAPPANHQSRLGLRTPTISAPIPIVNQRPQSVITTASLPLSQLNLPSESNTYLGFCKGAYKLQIGLPLRKAFAVETRPAGHYSSFQVWRCSKCCFEGPISFTAGLPGSGKKAGKPQKIFDPKIRVSDGGIRYRWAFLAKCHVSTKGTATGVRDGSFGTFGCLFCCAEGLGRGWLEQTERDGDGAGVKAEAELEAGVGKRRKGSTATTSSTTTSAAPMFGNVQSFMQHLEMHRTAEGTPGVEMQGRMNCVVGRVAEAGEDFDINLPPLEG